MDVKYYEWFNRNLMYYFVHSPIICIKVYSIVFPKDYASIYRSYDIMFIVQDKFCHLSEKVESVLKVFQVLSF